MAEAEPRRELWPLDQEAGEIWTLAAWIGKLSSDDALRSFTTLLIALLRSPNDLSRWFRRYCELRRIDVSAIYEGRQFSGQTWAEIDRARAAGETVDGKLTWTKSVDQLMNEAMSIAKGTGSPSAISGRHLLGAYLIGVRRNPTLQRDHSPQMQKWGFQLARESSAVLRQIRIRYPDELDRWSKLHLEAFQDAPDLESPDPLPESRLSGFSADVANGKKALQFDFIDIEDDVHSMASLICSRKVTPPLSIALFGDWGSGKTFFMNKLREAVDWMSGQARKSGQMQKDLTFYKHVVQIEFNAWNYSEGNLWASLVQHILDNLRLTEGEDEGLVAARRKQIEEQMNLQKSALSAAEEEKTRARVSLTTAQGALASLTKDHDEKLKDLNQVLAKDVWQTTAIPSEVKQELNKIRDETGLAQVAGSATALIAAIEETRGLLSRASTAFAPGKGAARIRFWLGAAAVLIIPMAAATVVPLMLRHVDGVVATMAGTSAWLSSLLGGAAIWIQRRNAAVAGKIAKVEELNAQIRQRVEAEKARQTAEVAEIEKRITLFQHEIVAAGQRMQEAQQHLTQAQVAFDHTTAASVLADLIEKRSDSQDYRRHLGLLAVVRRDFEAIAKLIDDQNQELLASGPGSEALETASRINRIVLYIDDLDRCSEEKVVEVLQAVHLLLALPLFVVVVGVDSRWVSQSLEKRFPGLLAASPDGSAASPRDYLEKIFQIPFWVKRMDDGAVYRMITGMFSENTLKAAPPPEGDPQPQAPADHKPAERPLFQRRQYEANPKSLDILPEEINFISKLGPLLGRSPRALKRFANTYRLIKASLPPDQEASFSLDHTIFGPPFQAVLFLLAVSTGFPEEASAIFHAIQNGQTIPQNLPPQLDKWLDDSVPDWQSAPTKSIAPWSSCVARYTFRPQLQRGA